MVKKTVKSHSKTELVSMLSEKTGFTQATAKQAVDAFIESITDILKMGGSVAFPGFGKFSVLGRSAGDIRHPGTGKLMTTKDSKVVKFSVSNKLKDTINSRAIKSQDLLSKWKINS